MSGWLFYWPWLLNSFETIGGRVEHASKLVLKFNDVSGKNNIDGEYLYDEFVIVYSNDILIGLFWLILEKISINLFSLILVRSLLD